MFRKNKTISIFIVGLFAFLGLVYFNYLKAQRDIRATKPSLLSVELVSFPEKIRAGGNGTFIWSVDASPDLTTPFTTIFWGEESSPSALTKFDSPAAVGYPNSQLDYATGSFSLPDTFDVNLSFVKPGKIWFRAYAKIKGEHLWSNEFSLEVEK